MTKRRNAQRYDISLPVIIRVPFKREAPSQIGKIHDISTQGVYLTIDNDLRAGTELDLTMTLPIEVTRGAEVLIRAIGKVVRVDKRSTDSDQPVSVVGAINRWEIVRNKAAGAWRRAARRIEAVPG
jgi:hypothetical protein